MNTTNLTNSRTRSSKGSVSKNTRILGSKDDGKDASKNTNKIIDNGRNLTDGRNLHSADIAAIIQSCKDAGVRELKYGGLELRFDAPELSQVEYEIKTKESLKIKQHIQSEAEKAAIKAEEFRIREEQVANLLLEDPVEYERLIMSGELKLDTIQDTEPGVA